MWEQSASPRASSGLGAVVYVMGILTGLAVMALVQLLVPEAEDDLELYRDVRDLIDATFVEPVDHRALLDNALTGMVQELDPYSRYYRTTDLPQLDRETDGVYRGIGVLFRDVASGEVLFPLPGSPAAEVGVRVGDKLLTIDGVAIDGLETDDIRARLKSEEPVALELLGRDGATRAVEIQPQPVVDPTVRHVEMLDANRGIGYVSIRSFSRRTPDEFDASIRWLDGLGLEAVVLDLRGNPGGVLRSAVQLANRFIEDGVIVSTTSRFGALDEDADDDLAALAGTPLVVLVDADSASASEVLAGALQDHRAGVIVGEPTYGKGAVQTLKRFEGEQVVVKITTAFYATPAGRVIERGFADPRDAAIAPDCVVPVSEEQRRRVQRHLADYGPPPGTRDALAAWEQDLGEELVARAPADPQLDAALALLRGELPTAGGAE